MQGLIDTHCHLDMLKAEIPEVLSAAKEVGVDKLITISVDEASQSQVISLSREWPNVFLTLFVPLALMLTFTSVLTLLNGMILLLPLLFPSGCF